MSRFPGGSLEQAIYEELEALSYRAGSAGFTQAVLSALQAVLADKAFEEKSPLADRIVTLMKSWETEDGLNLTENDMYDALKAVPEITEAYERATPH